MAKTKQAVFTIAFRLKNGISELLTVNPSNFVMPNTMPLMKQTAQKDSDYESPETGEQIFCCKQGQYCGFPIS